MKRKAYLLIFDGLADWEPAHALCQIHRYAGMEVVTVGLTKAPVVTMGGVRIVPDAAITDVRSEEAAVLILPGGEMWEQGAHSEVIGLLQRLHADHVLIAAICGATLEVARAGLMQGVRHTSNSLEYLKTMVPEYKEDACYVDELAVSDAEVITASGLGSLEFGREIVRALKIHDEEQTRLWFEMFKTGVIPEAFRSTNRS